MPAEILNVRYKMRALVATRGTNDPAKGDFMFCAEAELVFQPDRCLSEHHPDDCCCPALAGVQTRGMVNTCKVADIKAFKDKVDEHHETIQKLREVAESYEIGTILELRSDGFFVRRGEELWEDLILDD